MSYKEWLEESRGRKEGDTIVSHCLARLLERYNFEMTAPQLRLYEVDNHIKDLPDGVYDLPWEDKAVFKASVVGGRVRTFLPRE